MATTLTALPYSHHHYDSLPDIMDAAGSLKSSGFLEEAASSIGNIFIKHDVADLFGIILLHRHFDLEPTEKLVEFGNVSVPWDTACNKDEISRIHPTSWRFVPGGIVPYEFSNNAASQLPEDRSFDDFAQELGDLLREMHLDQLLGLSRVQESDIRSPGTMEFTSGRANVTVPDVMWALDHEHAAVEASWQFGVEAGASTGPVVFKKCKNKCEYKANTQTHAKRHLTTNK